MLKIHSSLLALAGAFVSFTCRAQFADNVVSYTQGSGITPTYNDPSRVLGPPTTFIGYQNADPFNPPYRTNDLVGVGAGGSLTLRFNTPIQNAAWHPFGADFIIFGHAGFAITNGDYTGGGITDGSLFTGGSSTTRVSVSADGTTYYTLDPARAPAVDGLLPTDASGNFQTPANPALTSDDFAGKDLAGIRALYGGSAGGAGFDVSWAQDQSGQSVALSSVDYVRVEVLSGTAYLDALAIVPEPSALALTAFGVAGFLVRRRKE